MTPSLSVKVFQKILQNSFRNFHAKGVDYVCLRRTPEITLKFYFFDIPPGVPEVVSPHTHRYDFDSTVIRGQVTNMLWKEGWGVLGRATERFKYLTPLNGGAGFEYDAPCDLYLDRADTYDISQTYRSKAEELHSLANVMPGTVLFIQQYADKLPLTAPTFTYVPGMLDRRGAAIVKPPSLEGLYAKFEAAQLWERLHQLETICPGAFSWAGE